MSNKNKQEIIEMEPEHVFPDGTRAELEPRNLAIELYNDGISRKTHWCTINYGSSEDLNDDWDLITEGHNPFFEGWEDGAGHVVGSAKATCYRWEYFDGNTGITHDYDTIEEAVKIAWDYWQHLTPRERIRYTDPKEGAIYSVFKDTDGEGELHTVLDFAEVLKDQKEGIEINLTVLLTRCQE